MHSSANGSIHAVPPEWNGRVVPFPRTRSVLDFFREQVEMRPKDIAVKDGPRLMTYQELDSKSNVVANELQTRGLNLEETVALLLPASCDFLAAIVGILKAGGTYFPMGTDIPAKRLEFLLEDSKARFLLASTACRERLPNWRGTILDLELVLGRAGTAEEAIDVVGHPDHLAYLLYTSGSTGQPKGVQVEHHSLTNFVCDYQRRFNLTARDRASMLAYVSFDVSMGDIWPVLCAGGTLIVPPPGILTDPDGLIRWLADEEVTFSFVPTGLVEILFAREWPREMKLRYLITGGDRLRVRPPKGLPFTVMNGYGPTESTVFGTFSVVQPEDGSGSPPPIGRPLDNVSCYVLDNRLQPLSAGEPGELYLGGEQVARGYLGRLELTRERFLPDPFSSKPGARMYRTGDWARWLPNGELDFLGRKDGQIQIRGIRVELGEIEALLFAHEMVRQVCCVPQLIDGMPTGLVAHIVPNGNSENPSEILRSHLKARLPECMVPSRFVIHERLPLTPQGKADRAAMAAMCVEKNGQNNVVVTAGDGLEKSLLGLWRSSLPEAVNAPRDAAFSELGGDSLCLVKLMLGVEEITRQRLEVSSFLVQPTFDGLCRAVKARLSRIEFQPVLTVRKRGSRPPIFFLYGHNGDIGDYFDLAGALGDDQPIYGIRSPALQDTARLPLSIEQAAAEALTWIRQIQPQGSLALAGYSWAGYLAFDIARQVAQAGGGCGFTALIGTTAPIRSRNTMSRAAHFLRYFPSWFSRLLQDNANRGRRLMRWRQMARDTVLNIAADNPPREDGATNPISQHMFGLAEKYQPFPKSEVTVDLFRERDDYQPHAHPLQAWQTEYLPDGGWNFWATGQNRVNWVEGDHLRMIRPPAVSGLARSIRLGMDQRLNRTSSR